jgi:NADH-quinone oxidoreductase subunit N
MVFMYMREPEPGAPISTPMKSGMVASALVIAAAFVIVIGVFPDTLLAMARAAGLR